MEKFEVEDKVKIKFTGEVGEVVFAEPAEDFYNVQVVGDNFHMECALYGSEMEKVQ